MRTTFTIWPPLVFLSVLLALAPGTSLCHADPPAKAAAGALDARYVRMAAKEAKKMPPAPVFGSCFDAEERLLYLYKRFWVDNKYPCVHVYRVK